MNEDEKSRFQSLAAADPRQFLYQVVRNSAFVDIEVILNAKMKRTHVKRTWAVNPAHDGIKVPFNRRAADEHQSLRRALRSFAKEAPDKFSKLVEMPTPSGKTAVLSCIDRDKVTPAALIESITGVIRLTRALSKRLDLESLLERCDFCEKVLLPLLQKMPQEKSMAQYASPAAPKAPSPIIKA
jgi:hypothetical protein